MIANTATATVTQPSRGARPDPYDVRTLRRLRLVTRRRVRVDVATIDSSARVVSDGELVIGMATVSPRDPRVLAWWANAEVDLVVVHDGCGARAVGGGGTSGRLELPGALAEGAFLAFCYDSEFGPSGL